MKKEKEKITIDILNYYKELQIEFYIIYQKRIWPSHKKNIDEDRKPLTVLKNAAIILTLPIWGVPAIVKQGITGEGIIKNKKSLAKVTQHFSKQDKEVYKKMHSLLVLAIDEGVFQEFLKLLISLPKNKGMSTNYRGDILYIPYLASNESCFIGEPQRREIDNEYFHITRKYFPLNTSFVSPRLSTHYIDIFRELNFDTNILSEEIKIIAGSRRKSFIKEEIARMKT